ncbi:helix-turn-helix transcriptional regulator [Paenibacillus melissococcoides]|uniref:Helix-turn-helix transcriptional regulator n=1 Tax=Paenibacillus melissococcoides TaxID=2912268 RepID=A0ABN8U6X8_9BACL|nr:MULTISPECIES: helix-turn-helix transcriptional regulator [Paenibacillus]MEB9895145.1 helix-turn-helix transcriptional regulator [Bacillus cereus]CAH8245714.1 helix-turn-helix transcriptional regulator [Paenibacillus melissococcoides]CAH8249843.1 helix-turn-helix transcriptional regulator [Paenibacillus melissococcoides]CAH8711866.1 helix-turn-helix transcriptional regulator [Paenibacillus melissococcoides]CAH8712611.1 helix-turn-helix transcriptional regulator [Paenibacillus melissococcoide
MIRLKLDEILKQRDISMYKLHQMTGIRPNTVSDLVNNKAKQWSPEALNTIFKALELESIHDLIEFVEDEKEPRE